MLSNDFIDNIKKLFADPADYIIDLSICPIKPSVTSENYKIAIGNTQVADTSAPLVSNQYVSLNCGQLQIAEAYNSFLDYSPYTQAAIYLPYIGTRELNIDDIMGAVIKLSYTIDVLTGSCVAALNVAKSVEGNAVDAVLYQWEGNVLTHVPIKSTGLSTSFQGIAGLLAGGAAHVAGAGVLGATLGVAALGAATLKPRVGGSGTLSGSAGLLSIQKPYLIITRPRKQTPNGYKQYTGAQTGDVVALSSISGPVTVREIHITDSPATGAELNELTSLLKGGVIFS